MTSWNPLTVLSGIARPSIEPASSGHPLGFADVRAQDSPLPSEASTARPAIGFSPTIDADAPGYRTELSFRRQPSPTASDRGSTDATGGGSQPIVGHASPAQEPQASVRDDRPAGDESIDSRDGFGFSRAAASETEPGETEPEVIELEIGHGETHAGVDDEPLDEVVADVVFEEGADFDVVEDSDTAVEDAVSADGTDDLWGESDDSGVAASPSVDDDVVAAADADEVADEDLAPDEKAPAPGNGRRSVRLRTGGPKSKSRRGSRGDRGGRTVVGLKIGASQIAAAVVQQVDGRSELIAMARTPLEPGIVVDGDVKDAIALTNALKTFFDEHSLPRRDVRIGLASNRIGVRTFDVVGVDDEERFDNAVRFKAHEVLPVAVHESLLDYRVVDERASEEGEPLRRVLLVVAPRDQVEPYLAVCRDAGIRLGGVDLEALGLLRAFVEPRSFATRSADDTATVTVAIGHESSTLLVAGGGACEFTRVFDWGGSTLQEAIAQELDVHSAEAATILRHLALSGSPRPLASLDDEARGRAMDAVRSKLTPFARELVSSLQFYQTQPDSLGIGEIVITGGTSHLVGLADALHQMIGVSVRVGDPLQRVVVRTGLDPAVEATIGSLAVPIGLAIEDDAVRSVNLLPTDLRQQGRKKPNLALVGLPVAAVVPVAALGFLFFQANGTVSDRKAEVQAVQAQIAALPKPKTPIIEDSVAAAEAARAVALAGVLGGRVSWDGVLRDVSLVLPGNVSLTRLEAQLPPPVVVGATPANGSSSTSTTTPAVPNQATGVEIEGYTVDQPSVARLLARLATLPSLSNVQLESTLRETVGRKEIVRFVVLADIATLGGSL